MRKRSVFRVVAIGLPLLLAVVAVLSWWSPAWWQRLIYPLEYRQMIRDNADANDVDPYLVAAVIYVESGFDPSSHSRAGARGLMQLLPSTAQEAAEQLGDKEPTAESLEEPGVSIRYGTWYLRRLIRKYDSTAFALAAYNGGGGNMDRWLKGREGEREDDVIAAIPFRETREFVARVRKTQGIYRRLYPDAFR